MLSKLSACSCGLHGAPLHRRKFICAAAQYCKIPVAHFMRPQLLRLMPKIYVHLAIAKLLLSPRTMQVQVKCAHHNREASSRACACTSENCVRIYTTTYHSGPSVNAAHLLGQLCRFCSETVCIGFKSVTENGNRDGEFSRLYRENRLHRTRL